MRLMSPPLVHLYARSFWLSLARCKAQRKHLNHSFRGAMRQGRSMYMSIPQKKVKKTFSQFSHDALSV